MKPVLAVLEFTASAEPKREKKLDEALQLVDRVDGAMLAFWGFDVGKGHTGCIVQVWKSLLHHRELLDHPDFSRVREALSACFSAPPTVSHVYYDEQSKALHHPILHILRAETTLPDDVRCRQRLAEAVKRVVGSIGKMAFGGQSLENPDVYLVFIGGTTVERDNPEENSAMAVAELNRVAFVEHRTLWLKSAVANPLERSVIGGEMQGTYSVPFTGKSVPPNVVLPNFTGIEDTNT